MLDVATSVPLCCRNKHQLETTAQTVGESSQKRYGPVAVLCRFFDRNFCNKGDELWYDHGGKSFEENTVRIALTGGLARNQVGEALFLGMSTLNRFTPTSGITKLLTG